MHIDDEHAPVREGQIVLIPPGSRQFIGNTGTVDLVFLCIVAPKWQPDDEILCR
jgi:mannose-6-phosphate isomerase-like protein (cupin superfamily)